MVGLRDRFTQYTSLGLVLVFCITVSICVPIRPEVGRTYRDYVVSIVSPKIVWFTILGVALFGTVGHGWYYGNFNLPSVLRDIEHFEVQYLQSTRQAKNECAWYAVLNACAIQELVHDRKAVTSSAISYIVRKTLIPFIQKNSEHILQSVGVSSLWDGLNDRDTGGLSRAMGLVDVYNISLSSQGGFPFLYSDTPLSGLPKQGLTDLSDSTYLILDLSQFLSVIMQHDAPVKQILLSMPSRLNFRHEVLISIVERRGKKPLLIYMDSNNTPFSGCQLDYVVPFFVCEFIKALDTAADFVAESLF